jgi:hypothetical protein
MFNLDAQTALGFLSSQTAHIESQVYETQYPDIQYPMLVPIDFSAYQWAASVEFYSMDKSGQAQWFNHQAKDVPLANATYTQHTHGIHMAAIGYSYTLAEIGQAMMIPGRNLQADRANAARRAYEEFMESVVLVGDAAKGFDSLIDSALPTTVTAAATGTGGYTSWAFKTGDQIAADVNNALSGIYTGSLTVEMADTLLLPIAEMLRLATVRMGDTNMSILEWLATHNVYTFKTGAKLSIYGLRQLDTIGDGGTGRMIAYRRDPNVLKVHMPMAFQFLPVWQSGPMMFDIPGVFRTGGLEIRRPGAVRYVDGIIDPSET